MLHFRFYPFSSGAGKPEHKRSFRVGAQHLAHAEEVCKFDLQDTLCILTLSTSEEDLKRCLYSCQFQRNSSGSSSFGSWPETSESLSDLKL